MTFYVGHERLNIPELAVRPSFLLLNRNRYSRIGSGLACFFEVSSMVTLLWMFHDCSIVTQKTFPAREISHTQGHLKYTPQTGALAA